MSDARDIGAPSAEGAVSQRVSETATEAQMGTRRIRIVLAAGVALLLLGGGLLLWQAQSRVNRVALASA
ncbi:MAG TPA: hypothetical protein VEJ89_07620, partial [Myxococcaceae bacterium]|nr:hypothetical protein [Myxococcaceae bacterium]